MPNITIYNDVILPESVIRAGVQGKNMRRNRRSATEGGHQTIDIGWSRTLRQFTLGVHGMEQESWDALQGLHEVTEGGAYGFLMLDPKDQFVTVADGLLHPQATAADVGTIGLGYGVPTLQAKKLYTSVGSTRTKQRTIKRPKSNVVLRRAGGVMTAGAGAGQYALNADTGIVTVVADSSSAVTVVTVGATTQITLTAALSGLAIGGRLWLDGLTGTDAALLNNLSHAITNITGGALNVYHLSTDTAGKTISVGSGQGRKYPQASESMTWAGSFYVPVHFQSDDLDWDIVRSGSPGERLVIGPSVVLDEVRE